MSETGLVTCPHCGARNRVRAAAEGVPVCGKCGRELPWLAKVTAADFEAVVEKSPVPVLVDFWAPWCGPCRIIEPAVEQLSQEQAGRLKVAKLNTDENPALQARFGVRGIPTLILFEGGRDRDRVTGAMASPALKGWVAARLPAAVRAREPRSGPAAGR